jgi:tRNA 2-selenouridine synthase
VVATSACVSLQAIHGRVVARLVADQQVRIDLAAGVPQALRSATLAGACSLTRRRGELRQPDCTGLIGLVHRFSVTCTLSRCGEAGHFRQRSNCTFQLWFKSEDFKRARSGAGNRSTTVRFDEIIDTRSEGEFAADHVPGAVSCPVLNDEERARIGTIYKQRSPFEARKLGSALVSGNISRAPARALSRPSARLAAARLLLARGRGAPRSRTCSPRSDGTRRAGGGYRAYRRTVVSDLQTLPHAFAWRVVCGSPAPAKAASCASCARRAHRVLDLEALAAHRGSVLVTCPGAAAAAEALREQLWSELKRLSPERPVYVEAESRRIGSLGVPESLIAAMWGAECVVLEARSAAA